jgi:hypothetical protein
VGCPTPARFRAFLPTHHSRGNAYAAHALLRAILDHIPPLLGWADFKAAANNYSWSRSDESDRASVMVDDKPNLAAITCLHGDGFDGFGGACPQ